MEDRFETRPPRPAWKRRLEAALWIAGVVTLTIVGWGWIDARLYQARQERLFEEALQAAVEPAAGGEAAPREPAAADPSDGVSPERVQPAEPAPGAQPSREPAAAATRRERATSRPAEPRAASGPLLARLTVPRLDMSVMVAPGLDSRTLRRAAGHITGTAPVGSGGNVGLAGHRDSFFRPLRHVRVGDEIVLTTPEAVSTYRVEWTEVVTPEATEVLRPTPYPALTLVTCYPFTYVGTAPDRLVVRARLVESRAPAAPERVAALTGG
jgi:sortase A